MVKATVEQRLDGLETMMDQVLSRLSGERHRDKDWRRTIGKFDDDPLMKEIIGEALHAREEERATFHDSNDRDNTDP